MTTLNPKGFKLPRVEKERFISLINLGLEYNQGLYSLKNCNNIEKIMETLGSILGTEVVFNQTCIRCGKSFPCAECKYSDFCTTKNLPFTCVCPQCLRDRKQFEQYLEKF